MRSRFRQISPATQTSRRCATILAYVFSFSTGAFSRPAPVLRRLSSIS